MPNKNEEAVCQCSICGLPVFIEERSPNGDMHKECDPEFNEDDE